MKPIFILMATLATFICKAETAEDIAPVVLKSFTSTFGSAKEVAWSVNANFYKAQFALDGQYINAFYNNDGGLMALTKNITTDQLPILLQAALKKESIKYWIADLFELSNEDGTTYYVALENADEKLVLKATSNNNWSNYIKTQKI